MPELEERIAVLEANFRHADAKLDKMAEKVDEMHEVLLQAKGARWAIIGVASFAGFLSGKLGAFMAAMGFKI
jgi:hypothetical protein